MKKQKLESLEREMKLEEEKLIGELGATSISGNDITASCFYVVGELAKSAGVYGPVSTSALWNAQSKSSAEQVFAARNRSITTALFSS